MPRRSIPDPALGRVHRGLNAYALGAEKEVRKLLEGESAAKDVLSDHDDLFRLLSLEVGNRIYGLKRVCVLGVELRQIGDEDATRQE